MIVKESGFMRDLRKALLVFFIFSALLIGVGIGYSVTPVKVVSSTITETSWRTTERVLRETIEHTVFKTMRETITIERTEFVETTITSTAEVTGTTEATETTTETEAATGTLQQPGEIGHGNFGGKSKVTVINDSPYKLRITLEGPESKEVIIEKCEVCHVYIIRPIFCPEEDRPSIDIMLKPGTYEVTVSTAEPTDVRPLAGSWTLEPNTWYGFCYYVLKKLA